MRVLLLALALAAPAFPLTVTTESLPSGCAGTPYPAFPVTASGGTGSGYTWSITAGSLPSGMTLTSAGVLSGIPPVNSMGAYPITIQVKDSAGAVATRPLTLTVIECYLVTTISLPAGTACARYSAIVLSATGGTGTGYTWSVVDGALPAGLTLSSSGVLSGNLSCSATTSTFTVQVQDSGGYVMRRQFTLLVYPPLVVTGACVTMLPGATIDCPVIISGGCPGHTCSIAAPFPGLSLRPDCSISGALPSSPGTFTFTLVVRDSCNNTVLKPFTAFGMPPLTITTGVLPAGTAGADYPAATIAAAGGTGTGYTWSVISGALPSGLTLSSTGDLSGLLSRSAVTSTFTLQVRDGGNNLASRQFTITVDPAAPPITTDSPFQVNYAANLQVGESFVNIVNTGANGAPLYGPGFGPAGNLCVNVYAFTPDEQLISCCSCLVTPNGLVRFAAYSSLVSNAQTPGATGTSGLVIKLVSTLPAGGGTSCVNSPAALTASTTTFATGTAAWRTTVHNSPAGYAVAETPFLPATMSAGEIASLSGRCAAIVGNASGYGVCRGCAPGASGSARF